MKGKALLALENGLVFQGSAIGVHARATGEVVFNTAMTGYQEILTDPSYAQQIITLTHPHIGNTGVNLEDEESDRVWATGLVIRDLPLTFSNWRSDRSLHDYLVEKNVVAIADIDTRKLTRVLREEGSQRGCIIAADDLSEADVESALAEARAFPGLKGMDLAREVTVSQRYEWRQGTWQWEKGYPVMDDLKYHVVAWDFGVKRNILRMLVDRGCRVTVVPAQTPASEVLALDPDGVFLSNGPGDPDPCDYAIEAIKEILSTDIPIFGICLGLQLLGLATGMKSIKMKHGHHGANHPVKDLEKETVLITSQNHGFCIDDVTLPDQVTITHRSLFDESIQGIRLENRPAYGFQGHPEASPGPHDAAPIFDHFIHLIEARASKTKK